MDIPRNVQNISSRKHFQFLLKNSKRNPSNMLCTEQVYACSFLLPFILLFLAQNLMIIQHNQGIRQSRALLRCSALVFDYSVLLIVSSENSDSVAISFALAYAFLSSLSVSSVKIFSIYPTLCKSVLLALYAVSKNITVPK